MTRFFRRVPFVLAALMTALVFTAAPSHADNRWAVRITNDNSGLCVTPLGGIDDWSGTPVHQGPCSQAPYIETEYVGTYLVDWYRLIVEPTAGRCLMGSDVAGEPVRSTYCEYNTSSAFGQLMLWAFVEDTNGKYRWINYGNGNCMAIPGASTTPGVNVIVWPCGQYADHYWYGQ